MQLIVFRAIQGIGGGGLLVSTQAAIGDVVPPRERGRYQGIFGAVFGVSSIAGPLLGGYFTTHLSWRWIFYINLPLGTLALVVIGATLPQYVKRISHRIDYLGTSLLAVALSCIVLYADLGGVLYDWSSPQMVVLGVTAILSLIAFVAAERRAAEPVLPLSLFANKTFRLTSVIGLIVGFALFGSVTYIPLFLQVVNGATPTGSGLQMLPLMGGMLFTSISSGQLISRWGRYRIFPIIGTATTGVGLFLLSRMDASTQVAQASIAMAVLGLGLGLIMQVLVIAVQNAVDYRELGVATSGATLFRLIGGALGTAVFGAIFASRLQLLLSRNLPAEGALPPGTLLSPEALMQLPPAVYEIYISAFTSSLSTVFLVAMVIALFAFLLTWLVPELPLRDTIAATAGDVGREAELIFPMPTDTTSLSRLERSLSLLASRDIRREYFSRIVSRAEVNVGTPAAWLLLQIEADPSIRPGELARSRGVPAERLEDALAELRSARLVEEVRGEDGELHLMPSAAGRVVLGQLVTARRERLREEVASLAPEVRSKLEPEIRELVPDGAPEPVEERSASP